MRKIVSKLNPSTLTKAALAVGLIGMSSVAHATDPTVADAITGASTTFAAAAALSVTILIFTFGIRAARKGLK